MTVVKENGREYVIKNGIVVEAREAKKESVTEFKVTDRVVAQGKTGAIISRVPTVYGDAFGVKFDDGEVDSFIADQLETAPIEKKAYASSIDEILGDYVEFEAMPDHTTDEIDLKIRVARQLNLRAKAVSTDRTLPLADRIGIDRVVTATAVDVMDLERDRRLAVEIPKDYLDKFERFELPESIDQGSGGRMNGGGDMSWIQAIEVETTGDSVSDAQLIQMASKAADSLTYEQLTDLDFMKDVVEMQKEVIAPQHQAKFSKFFHEVRISRTNALAREASTKTASVDEEDLDLASFDMSQFYV